MAVNNDILQELNELESSLSKTAAVNPYVVPAGYFEGLAAQIITRIRALEAKDAHSELSAISDILINHNRTNPYTVEANYFEELPSRMLHAVTNSVQTVDEELESISPLLSGLKKEMPYEIPQGYFNTSPVVEKTQARVVSMGRRKNWLKYAAAAVIVAMVSITTVFVINQNKSTGEPIARLTNEIKTLNDAEQDKLADYIDAGINGSETVQLSAEKTKEIHDLLKDISETELQDFQQQTEDLQDILSTSSE